MHMKNVNLLKKVMRNEENQNKSSDHVYNLFAITID